MNILYQYYNEIVLTFKDYDVDFKEGIIEITVPPSTKPFDNVYEKISSQIQRIAETLDSRNQTITMRIKHNGQYKELILEKEYT